MVGGAHPDNETDVQLTAAGKKALFCPKMPNEMSGLCFRLLHFIVQRQHYE